MVKKTDKKKDIEDENNTNFDLTILPVREDGAGINIRRPFHPMLPNIKKGSATLLLGQSQSGKTTTLINLILNNNFLRDSVDDVYTFSLTLNQDATGRKIKEAYPATSYDNFDEGRLQKILDYQASYDPEDRPSIILILDDLPQTLRPKSLFYSIVSQYRHYGIAALIYSVQAFKMVPPIVRNNISNFLIGTVNTAQQDMVAETYGEQFGGKDNFLRYYRLAVPERFNFLYGRLDVFPPILHKNFDENILYREQL